MLRIVVLHDLGGKRMEAVKRVCYKSVVLII